MKKYFLIFGIFGLLIGFCLKFSFFKSNSVNIIDYNEKEHREDVKRMFFDNYYWAVYDIPLESYSFEDRFDNLKVQIDKDVFTSLFVKIAMDGNKVAGYITYYSINKDLGHIQILVVDKNHRRKGIGEKLIKAAIDDLVSKGHKIVHLITKKDDIPAQNLYKKVGFVYFDKSEYEDSENKYLETDLAPAMDFVYRVS